MGASPPKPQGSVGDDNSSAVVASGGTPATTVGGTDDQDSGDTLDGGDSASSSVTDVNTDKNLLQKLTQLVQTQTAMFAAHTKAMSAQSLPPLPHYSGESHQLGEDDFDIWIG